MKKFYRFMFFSLLLCMSLTKAKAQWVTIPDTNFVNWLNTHGYAGCLNGSLMDTTCNAVVTTTYFGFSNALINNLDGIQYFDSLITLSFSNTLGTPSSKQVNNIPALPRSLRNFNSFINAFTSLPPLPDSLIQLSSVWGNLQSLPTLPSGLKILDCNDNNIDTMPPLPPALKELTCSWNQLTFLPTLPSSLTKLVCGKNSISALPLLPDSLRYLDCRNNLNLALPVLPDSLQQFYCHSNQWTTLPILPDSLKSLGCNWNLITSFLPLPPSLQSLSIGCNPITSFPPLPSTLLSLGCDSINLTSFPFGLPPNLETLFCSNNPLTSLPALPSSLNFLKCQFTPLTYIPDLNDSMFWVEINYNTNLQCFPKYRKIDFLYWGNTSIQCLPNAGYIGNATPSIASLPICSSISPCEFNWSMYGRIYKDTNSNCLIDTTEQLFKNMKVNLSAGGSVVQSFIFNTEGYYSFKTSYGNYEIKIDTAGLPFDVVCPVSGKYNSLISAIDSTDEDLDFGLRCKPGYFDLVAKSIASYYHIRPGAQLKLFLNSGDASLFYGVTCATGVSGTVTTTLSGPVNYVSPDSAALTPTSVIGNTITWSVNDFSLVSPTKDFNINISIDTTATVFDTVCVQLAVSPFADSNPLNNSLSMCMPVVNSFDPNEKHVFPQGDIDTSQQWLTYTIYFQNTGNALAEDITLLDTLDNDLDKNSFQFLSSSHDPIIQILPNSILRFNFPNINLPDSTNNEPESHGYVQYKVKLKSGLPIGTTIENTAHIYFDFNAPVITNTTQNTIVLPTGVEQLYFGEELRLYPNPVTNGILKINFRSPLNQPVQLTFFDVTGRKVFSSKLNSTLSAQTIALPKLANGVYTCELTAKGLKASKKLVILSK